VGAGAEPGELGLALGDRGADRVTQPIAIDLIGELVGVEPAERLQATRGPRVAPPAASRAWRSRYCQEL